MTVHLDTGAGEHAAGLVRGHAHVREVTTADGVVRAYVTDGEAAVPALLRTLEQGGCTVDGIALTRPGLDDVFLQQSGRFLRDQPEPQPA